MEWIEATVQTCPEGTELLCAALTEAGFDSFQTEDCAEFETFLQTSQEYWDYVDEALTQRMQGRSVVRLWLASETAQRELERLRGLLAALPARFPGAKLGALTLSLETVPDADWETDWQKNYRPLPVGEKLLIVPSWMSVGQTDGRLPILLNLGMTFGTGEHPSTQMCLSELERHIRGGERVADLGSGSGILSIAALRLGAGTATGIDVDPAAVVRHGHNGRQILRIELQPAQQRGEPRAAADHRHGFIFIKSSVANRAKGNSVSDKILLTGNAQKTMLDAGG